MRLLRPASLLLFALASSGIQPSAQSLPPLTLKPGVQPPAAMVPTAVTVDAARHVYYAGSTTDPSFPTTAGAYSHRCGVDGECGLRFFGRRLADIVVVKMGRDGGLQLSTFLGGDGQLTARFITLGPDGSIFVAGDFAENPSLGPQRMPFANPTVPGCGQTDVFVAKLDPERLSLVYWTCIQGPFRQAPIQLRAIGVDRTGALLVGGHVNNPGFPVFGAVPPFTTRRSGVHGYLKKLLPNGDVAFSMTLGGAGLDAVGSVATDSRNNIYLAGYTTSPDMPVARPFQPSLNGPDDGYLAKIDPDGRTLLFGTYLGGSYTDEIWDVAVDHNDEAWVVGDTHSIDFPTTANALRSVSLCAGNPPCAVRNPAGFATRFDPAGRLSYSTLIGPANIDPNGPSGARLSAVQSGPSNELYLFGDFTPALPLVRAVSGSTCSGFCGHVLIIRPPGDLLFSSQVPSGNSVLGFAIGASGRWSIAPDGAMYFLRAPTFRTTELVIVEKP